MGSHKVFHATNVDNKVRRFISSATVIMQQNEILQSRLSVSEIRSINPLLFHYLNIVTHGKSHTVMISPHQPTKMTIIHKVSNIMAFTLLRSL